MDSGDGFTNLTFRQLARSNKERCEDGFGHKFDPEVKDYWTASDWVMATVGELGELANLLKKRRRGEDIPQIEIEHEIADTLIYLDLLATHLDIDLEKAVRRKFNIVSDRVGSNVKL